MAELPDHRHGAKEVRVFNNTIYGNGERGLYIGAGSNDAEVRNNIAYGHRHNLWNSGRDTTLSHNVTEDPKFLDAGKSDVRLRPR